MTADDLDKLLAVIGDHAERLRDKGVLSISVDGIAVKLAAPTPQLPAAQPPKPRVNPFEDPTAYGLPEGAEVPGLDWFAEVQAQRNKELAR